MNNALKYTLVAIGYVIVIYIINIIIGGVVYIFFPELTRLTETVLATVALCCSTVFTAFLLQKYILKEPFRDIGFQKCSVSSIVRGMLMAATVLGACFLTLYLAGYCTVEDVRGMSTDWWVYLLIFILVGITEEVAFRGVVQRVLSKGMNKWIAWVVAACIFSLVHIDNDNFSFLPFVNILLAGLLLGGVYMYTNNLLYPISLHFFWNFLQGNVLGFSVSGNIIPHTNLKVFCTGSELMTGGAFGLEGSILCTIFLVIAIIVDVGYRHHIARHYK